MPTEYLTVAQAVERFGARGVTEAKIRNWLKTGRIHRFLLEFDSTTMVRPDEVEAVLRSLENIIPAQKEED